MSTSFCGEQYYQLLAVGRRAAWLSAETGIPVDKRHVEKLGRQKYDELSKCVAKFRPAMEEHLSEWEMVHKVFHTTKTKGLFFPFYKPK